MSEKISVIIPLFNKGPYIARALNSVLNQTYQDFEVIVVDDGSTDNGAEIVRGFDDPRIRLIRQENRGVSATRNQGFDKAISDYIAFLDADDEWMPKHLETILRLIENFPLAGMYTTAYKRRTPSGKTRWDCYKFIPHPPWEGLIPDYFKSAALGESPVCSSVVVIPRKIFIETGGFPEGYWYGEDADLFGKIALKYPVAFSWELGALYHWDVLNRACDRQYPWEHEMPFVKTARRALNNKEVPIEFIQSLNEYISKVEIDRAQYNVHAGNSRIAKKILKQCNTRWHYNRKMKWWFLATIPSPLFLFLRDIRRKFIKIMRIRYPSYRKAQ
jgi:glycosyltransferase involved in cell wall biosynthesis